ncbi:MAG: hypothetical protein ACHQLQ_04110 [Candidatus Acidiferrales bacterium]
MALPTTLLIVFIAFSAILIGVFVMFALWLFVCSLDRPDASG